MSEHREYLDGTPFNGVIGRTAQESVPAWPVPKGPPEGAPNVLIIVLDDTGFGQIGCYGGLGGRIETPNMDRLADNGLRYRNFHTTALCSPTRACVLTGRNHHTVGIGNVMEFASGFPGYNGRMPKDSAMLPEVLVENGYNTMAIGKWHLAPDEHITAAGPFDRWPLGQGFERFYGFLPGETSQWQPDLWEDNHKTEPPATPEEGYHLTTDLVDHAIEWVAEQHAVCPNKPFFLYLASGAMHSPHHAPKEYIERYKGRFDDGWDVVREETLERQMEMGIVPESTELPPRNPGIAAWEELSEDQKRLYARQMEVFAAFLTHLDDQLGRLFGHLERAGLMENTLVMLLSDNGASSEGGPDGMVSDISWFNVSPQGVEEMLPRIDELGGPTTHPHYARGWAMAGNTPNRWYKQLVHEGGTRDPLIVHWPRGIDDPGAVRGQFHHAVDVTPTVLDVLGLEMPLVVKGHEQRPIEGKSMKYTFADADAPTNKTVQYFEMLSHRAIWAGGWKAVTVHWSTLFKILFQFWDHEAHDGDFDADEWELYNIDEDFSEVHDLAAEHPEKLKELIEFWWAEAEEHNVLPLDDSIESKIPTLRPRTFEDRDSYTFHTPVRLIRPGSPLVKNRSHVVKAEVEIPDGGAKGVIVSDGGMEGGYTLCIRGGRLHYVSNYLGREWSVVSSEVPVPPGAVTLGMAFEKTEDFAGKVTLYMDGRKVGEGEVPRSNPVINAVVEGFEVGSDSLTPVWPEYESPFEFTGKIDKVELRLEGPEHLDIEKVIRLGQLLQ